MFKDILLNFPGVNGLQTMFIALQAQVVNIVV